MKRKVPVLVAAGIAAAVFSMGWGIRLRHVEAALVEAPRFEVDPFWPKPLPNHWVIGAVIGVAVDGNDNVWILTSFGGGGWQPGQFYAVHSIATGSKGNIYTTETYRDQRVQKFVYRGLAAVTKRDQGVVWPRPGRNYDRPRTYPLVSKS
ncbi:MAG: hypothetical protein IT161_02890 [Bryobacterales bacterium]|nr:hypothetical protein [Bryobacterales bacterium]